MPKIALLFLTIANIYHEQHWIDFLHGHQDAYSIYVHAKQEIPEKSFLKPFELPIKIPTAWARTSKAQRALLRAALTDPSNEKFILVSESCVPLQDFNTVYETVFATDKSFMCYFKSPHQGDRSLDKIPEEHRYKNWQWIILNRKHAQLMAEDEEIIDVVTQYHFDNEHYQSTFLSIKNLLHEVTNKETTFVYWDTDDYQHPFAFTNLQNTSQYNLLKQAIDDGFFFARKITVGCDLSPIDHLLSYRKK